VTRRAGAFDASVDKPQDSRHRFVKRSRQATTWLDIRTAASHRSNHLKSHHAATLFLASTLWATAACAAGPEETNTVDHPSASPSKEAVDLRERKKECADMARAGRIDKGGTAQHRCLTTNDSAAAAAAAKSGSGKKTTVNGSAAAKAPAGNPDLPRNR
jgi:hypothetical protein